MARAVGTAYWLVLVLLELRTNGWPHGTSGYALLTLLVIALPVAIFLATFARHRRVSEANALAFKDDLTGLANRRSFFRWVEQLTDRDEVVDLVLLDVDGLKDLNENCGHQSGDELLVYVASFLKEAYSNGGEPYRIGGDEFAVVIPSRVTEAAAAQGADAGETFVVRFSTRGHEHEVHLASGAAQRHTGEASSDLIRRADVLLRESKRRRYEQPSRDRRLAYRRQSSAPAEIELRQVS